MIRRLYHSLPLPASLRQRISQWRRAWQRRSINQESIHQRPINPEEADTPVSGFAWEKACADCRDYVFFGVIDWHFRHQRPQHLAREIARSGRRVFYISVNFIDREAPSFDVERIDPHLALYQVNLHVAAPLNVYSQKPTHAQLVQLKASLCELWTSAGMTQAVSVIQHPFWRELAATLPASRAVYDCMDHHAGFSNTDAAHSAAEKRLLAQCDLTVVTSDYLEAFARPLTRRVAMIRNATEFDHFNAAAGSQKPQPGRRRVIGYYGAIAEWFDVELLSAAAKKFADCDFLLIGDDTAQAAQALRRHSNVRMTGEVPYASLPQWLAQFDVCLIPFQVNDLTLATNPVKVYEYLSAGKPVVSTDLPELRQFGDLVYRATGTENFLAQVQSALDEGGQDEALTRRRIDFARGQTWAHRAASFLEAAENTRDEPAISVVVVAYHQWHLTQRCLESLERHREGMALQVIVVDNASSDDTPAQLKLWASQDPAHRLAVINDKNLGFGGGVNAGMVHATGDFLVILNNDTIVGPGWARGMRRHFQADPALGLLCPVTNNIGNEAQVALAGNTPQEVFASAERYCLKRAGNQLALHCAAFFCVMIPRAVWEEVGPMDERFFPGYFEDDDYCMRVRQVGRTIGCAEDVFVYHELSASFDREGQARRQAIFARSKALYEEKWGAWQPHTYRPESLTSVD